MAIETRKHLPVMPVRWTELTRASNPRTRLAAAGLCLIGTAAMAQGDLVWESSEYPAEDPAEIGLSIGLGVPQTDAILVSGACFEGADGRPVFQMLLGANPGTLPDGAAVLAEIDGDGASASLVGRVTGASGEPGVTGVATELRLGDPVLLLLSSGAPLRVSIAGGGDDPADYPMTDATALRDYLDACTVAVMGEMPADSMTAADASEGQSAAISSDTGAIAPLPQAPAPAPQAAVPQPAVPQTAVPQTAVPQTAVPQPTVPQPAVPVAQPAPDAGAEYFSCSTLGQVVSQDTGQPRSVMIDNRSPEPRSINWVGPDGSVTEFGQLQPGQNGTLTSDAGHVWMFADPSGACVEVARVSSAQALLLRQTAAIAPPQPTFTPAPTPQAPADTK